MTRSRSTRRGGFTLLEVLLASALAVILMAALYVALDVQLRLADAGRESIEQATLTRAIVQRFENDLAGSVSPVAPAVETGRSNQGGGSGAGAGGAATAGAGAGTSGAGATGAGTTGMEGEAVTEVVMSETIPFQAGVIGESDRLTIFAVKVAGQGKNLDETGEAPTPADIRRVTYWVTDKGLARQELPWLTSEQLINSTDPIPEDGKEESDYVIAEEVTRIQFEYWDGSAWADTWDGRQTNADGKTLRGPPMAIRVHFWLNVPGPNPGETIEKEFRHTIAVRSAAGPAVPDAETTQTGQ
jgi:prepilin-type N-terminal cleavage/methylation domain-containing protein